jgi:DNA-binding IclR family transcriptional regulator
MTRVPAASQTLALLRALAERGPSTAATLARAVNLPRSTTYHLLAVLRDEGFVVHLPEERRWSLGPTAFSVGQAYLRHDPRESLARPLIIALADAVGQSAHLGVLHGTEVVYLIKESPRNRLDTPTLITGVGVHLPAAITASGRAMLAHLPKDQLRALMSSPDAFVRRTSAGPDSLSALRRVLDRERERGYAHEEGEVLAGYASVAAALLDRQGHPVASVSVTYRTDQGADAEAIGREVVLTARAISARG